MCQIVLTLYAKTDQTATSPSTGSTSISSIYGKLEKKGDNRFARFPNYWTNAYIRILTFLDCEHPDKQKQDVDRVFSFITVLMIRSTDAEALDIWLWRVVNNVVRALTHANGRSSNTWTTFTNNELERAPHLASRVLHDRQLSEDEVAKCLNVCRTLLEDVFKFEQNIYLIDRHEVTDERLWHSWLLMKDRWRASRASGTLEWKRLTVA